MAQTSDSRETSDSRPGTEAHIGEVRRLLGKVLSGLTRRAMLHDRSKLESPEVEHFDRAAFRLAGCAYGSAEYRNSLADLKPALDHHYAVNSHHPEHYPDGICGMNLLDLMEMIADWVAAVQRHDSGQIFRSIEINKERFGMSDDLTQIFINTVCDLFPEEAKKNLSPNDAERFLSRVQ